MADANSRRQFATLVAAALVDGDLAEKERQVLHRKATEMDIPMGLMSDMIAQARQGKLTVSVPATTQDKEALLDDLIDVTCADGRVEAPEHHLLAKFAAHLGILLPDLRARVKLRMDKNAPRQTRVQPRPEPARPRPEPLEPSPVRKGPAPPSPELTSDLSPTRPPGEMQLGMAAPSSASMPLLPPGPMQLDPPKPLVPGVSDIPPITLQLLKQAILFETDPDAVRYIERTLNISRPEAEKIRDRLLSAFPELRSNKHQMKIGRGWTNP